MKIQQVSRSTVVPRLQPHAVEIPHRDDAPNTALESLFRAEQQGLDANRLLFARFLHLTSRLSDELPQPDRWV